MSRAACKGKPTSWFYPEQHDPHHGTQARAVCATCPVRGECLAAALERSEHGFWGGKSVMERKELRGKRGTPAPIRCGRCSTVFDGVVGRTYCDECRQDARRESTHRWREGVGVAS